MQPYASQLPPVLCLQNGVENEAAIAEVLGSQKVIPGSVTSAIGREATGEIVLERLRGVGIAAGHPLSGSLVEAFNQAGLNARLYPPLRTMKWSKMLTNLLANASSAILDMTPAEIFAHQGLYQAGNRPAARSPGGYGCPTDRRGGFAGHAGAFIDLDHPQSAAFHLAPVIEREQSAAGAAGRCRLSISTCMAGAARAK